MNCWPLGLSQGCLLSSRSIDLSDSLDGGLESLTLDGGGRSGQLEAAPPEVPDAPDEFLDLNELLDRVLDSDLLSLESRRPW